MPGGRGSTSINQTEGFSLARTQRSVKSSTLSFVVNSMLEFAIRASRWKTPSRLTQASMQRVPKEGQLISGKTGWKATS